MKFKKLSNWQFRPVFGGIIGALLFFHASLLPSLLPRPWLLQGFVTGVSTVIGYGLGLGVSAMIRWFVQKEMSAEKKAVAWKIMYVIAPVYVVISLVSGQRWQNEVRSLLDVEQINIGYSLRVIVATLFFIYISYWIGRGTRNFARKIQRWSSKHVPKRLAVGLGGLASALLVYFLVSGVLFSTFFKVADSMFATRDDTTREGIVQPVSAARSGSPDSLIGWDELGYQGQIFVGEGPSKEQIEDYTGEPAKEPIRVYAGMKATDDPDEQAELAVKDLKRAGGFEREVLVIATPTGSGWINSKAVDPLELMHGGDTAIVTQQYSYLPSWISFLVDKSRAETAGRAIFDAVIEEWDALPEDDRPQLYAYGLSLGSFGGNDAFSGVNDMRRSVDGVLFEGTPNDTTVWRKINKDREEGTPEYQPIYDGAENVKFASTKEDILEGEKTWVDGQTRILYMQHANDPIVWFSFDLIFNEPDWLKEPRGPRVSDDTDYYPIVTFMHLGLDQMIGNSAPPGNGHTYNITAAYEWAAVTQPEGWTVEDSDKLQEFIDNDFKGDQSH
jgi:uncharacterized membrane protein